MLDKPKCKLCGVRHWSNEAHEWPKMAKPEVAVVRESVPVDRKAYLREYMREYMRKRRGTQETRKA